MSTYEEQNRKIFKARRTMLQILKDMGYSVPDSDIKMSKQDFDEKFGQNVHLNRVKLSIPCKKGDAPTDKVHIFLPTSLFNFYLWRVQFLLVNRLFLKSYCKTFQKKCKTIYSFPNPLFLETLFHH